MLVNASVCDDRMYRVGESRQQKTDVKSSVIRDRAKIVIVDCKETLDEWGRSQCRAVLCVMCTSIMCIAVK